MMAAPRQAGTVSIPVTVRAPGWARNPTTSAWKVAKVRTVKQGANAASTLMRVWGNGIVGIGGRPGSGGNRPPNLTGGVPGEQVRPALMPHVTATPLTHQRHPPGSRVARWHRQMG
jgi:hypothetical protein